MCISEYFHNVIKKTKKQGVKSSNAILKQESKNANMLTLLLLLLSC